MTGEKEPPGSSSGGSHCCHMTRYLILVVTLVCLTSVLSNIFVFNFTVLCMNKGNTYKLPMSSPNATEEAYNNDEKQLIFSAVAVGAIIAVIPTTHFIQSHGARIVFFVMGMVTATATALVPLAATTNSTLAFFLIVRIFQGMSFAACMPTAGVLTSSWASLKQNGLFMSVLTSFAQLCNVFSMPVSGQLCSSSLGWQSVYYLHAALSYIFFILWFFLYRNRPEKHPLVDKIELEKIVRGKTTCAVILDESNFNVADSHHQKSKASKESKKIPYLAILKTPSIWGVWIASIGDLLSIQLIATFSPQYLKEMLGYSMKNTGLTAALPVLFQFFIKIAAGYSSDRIRCLSELTKLRLYNSIALGLSAFFMIALAFVSQGSKTIGLLLLTVTAALFGFNGGGFNKCATLVSRQYSQFVLGNIQLIWCLSMLICPNLVLWILREGTIGEWRIVFILHAVILLITNAIFCFTASAEAAPWTNADHTSNGAPQRSDKLDPITMNPSTLPIDSHR
ncbi:hypothetical protein AB6A40_006177 [Gnathostoma spinigerum]|uniref:Major facilitator superfamily (MFS) profile domain-containing protein n=1 Tax=Gnathostoma spinigerum TaxID=75299 RepID=A0ABD6ER30_9BILA